MKYWKLLSVFAILLVIFACTSEDGGPGDNPPTGNDSFDRGAMLANWADNIIVPSFTSFESDAGTLKNATNLFVDAPSVQNLQQLRLLWEKSYVNFQNVAMFDIGKAEEIRFRDRLNIYPTSASKIEGFIANGNYNLELPSTIDAQGFPALDYMINGLGATDTEIVDYYTINANASAYKEYLKTLSETIAQLTTNVLEDWNNGYRDAFVANISSSASGSVDKLANDYIFYFEKSLRAGKVGIPAGVFSNEVLPQKVEAFYKKDISEKLLLESINACKRFFNGGNNGGESFKTYLDFLNTIKNGADLATIINTQFDVALSKANTLNADFTQQIATDNFQMLETYNELQRNVILLKVDMLQALDINVDYVDTDGD